MNRSCYPFLMLLLSFIVGCSSNLKTRYPGFYQSESHTSSIDVVIDTFVVSDISGADLGINLEKNAQAVANSSEALLKGLAERGFEPNILLSSNGLFYTFEDDKKYFYSEGFKSTGEEYRAETIFSPEWATLEVKDFVDDLFERPNAKLKSERTKKNYTKSSSLKARKEKENRVVVPTTVKDIPDVVFNSSSDKVLFLRAYCGDVSKAKSITTGIATGLATAILTGGMYAHAGTAFSGSDLEVVVFNKKTRKVVWHNKLKAGSYGHLDKGVKMLLQHYPTVEGKILPNVVSQTNQQKQRKKR